MKKWLPFLAVFTLGVLLRFYKLGIIPLGYTWDEVSTIYDAWGLALWHRDQYASFLPLTFKSFGDYKAPLMFYLLAIPYKLFGLSEILIRIYSAIAGMIIIITTYFLSLEIFPKKKKIALLAAFLIALSPWAIQFSRFGFDGNIALALTSLAILFLIKGEKKPSAWIISAIIFAASLYAYQSVKIFVPLILLAYLVFKRKLLRQKIKKLFIPSVVFLILIAPLIYSLVFSGAAERGKSLIFFDQNGQINTAQAITTEFFHNLSNQLSPSFWIKGYDASTLRHSVPGHGTLYKIEAFFFLLGIVFLTRQKNQNKSFILSWLFIGLLPAILSHTTPHASRSLATLPAPQLIASFGFITIIKKLTNKSLQVSRLLIIASFVILSFESISYLTYYYNQYKINSATSFNFGYKQAITIAKEKAKTKDTVVFTDKYGQPYIFILLYQRTTPEEFLAGGLANYFIAPVKWPPDKPNSVYVATPEEIPPDDPFVTDTISIPNTKDIIFVIAETPKTL